MSSSNSAYITIPYRNKQPQITISDLLSGSADWKYKNRGVVPGATRTYKADSPSELARGKVNTTSFYSKLWNFVQTHKDLYDIDRKELYHTFFIPKAKGGYRQIDEPLPPLMTALRELKRIFEEELPATHHTSAFAYVQDRCAVDAVKRHQRNKSRWVLKIDMSNFFGSTTPEFLHKMLSKIFPISELYKNSMTELILRKALELCFLNGGLPQGTPISPLLTNLMMIPIDYEVSNRLKNYNNNHYVYTRYADDIDISCRVSFMFTDIVNYVKSALAHFDAPFTLNDKKTHYGSTAGRNWMLGVMLNKDNEITIGHERKKLLKSKLSRYIIDHKNGKFWDVLSIQKLGGELSYFRSIEPSKYDYLINNYNKKFGVDISKCMKEDLNKGAL